MYVWTRGLKSVEVGRWRVRQVCELSAIVILMFSSNLVALEGAAGRDLRDESQSSESAITREEAPKESQAEEPDFAFIAGGPYTQPKGSYQLIMAGQFGTRRIPLGSSTLRHSEYGTLFRNEWGLTDRWELDLVAPAGGEKNSVDGIPDRSSFAMADSVVGIRYRLFKEGSFPFTVTMGPQVILPTGNVGLGTGAGSVGYAWDISTAKDWGGPVFVFNSFNYSFFPSAADTATTSPRRFTLQDFSMGSALGFRVLEAGAGHAPHHDLHGFLEFGVARSESICGCGGKSAEVNLLAAPGIRYGFMTHYVNGVEKHLLEVGVSFPLGLNNQTPRSGVIVQVQFEHILKRWAVAE